MSDEDDYQNPINLEYQIAAGKIAKAAYEVVAAACVPGAKIYDLCALGDSEIMKSMEQVELEDEDEEEGNNPTAKGICYPTCISVNKVFGHFSPSKDNKAVLKKGDLVKIELGAHIQGMIAVHGETIVCGSANVEGDVAKLLMATTTAAHAALHILRPGATNEQMTQVIATVADAFDVSCVKKNVAYQVKRYVIDARKQIWMAPQEPGDEPLECREVEFETDEAYCIDIRMTTGSGNLKLSPENTTVYKRDVDMKYVEN